MAEALSGRTNVTRNQFVSPKRNQSTPDPGDFHSRRPFFDLYGLTQVLDQHCNCDNSSYNALQTKLQKRFSHGLDFLLTYLAKAMSNAEGGMGVSDNYNLREESRSFLLGSHHTVTLI